MAQEIAARGGQQANIGVKEAPNKKQIGRDRFENL